MGEKSIFTIFITIGLSVQINSKVLFMGTGFGQEILQNFTAEERKLWEGKD